MEFVIYSASVGYAHDRDRSPCDRAYWGTYEVFQEKQFGRTKHDADGSPLMEVVDREGWLIRLADLADLDVLAVETGHAVIYNPVAPCGDQLPQLTIVDGRLDW